MNTCSVPSVSVAGRAITSRPPSYSAYAVAREPSDTTMGKNRALKVAARTEDFFIRVVSSVNSSMFFSSRTRVLVVFAPMMPSLNAPVILEFVFRTSR